MKLESSPMRGQKLSVLMAAAAQLGDRRAVQPESKESIWPGTALPLWDWERAKIDWLGIALDGSGHGFKCPWNQMRWQENGVELFDKGSWMQWTPPVPVALWNPGALTWSVWTGWMWVEIDESLWLRGRSTLDRAGWQ